MDPVSTAPDFLNDFRVIIKLHYYDIDRRPCTNFVLVDNTNMDFCFFRSSSDESFSRTTDFSCRTDEDEDEMSRPRSHAPWLYPSGMQQTIKKYSIFVSRFNDK